MVQLSDYGLRVVRRTRVYASCHCPLHDDKHASALVYLDNMWFVCFVCNISKPLVKVLQEAGMEWRGLDGPLDSSLGEFDFLEDGYKVKPLTEEALKYLSERGLDAGSVPNYVSSPVHDKGVAFTFRSNQGLVVGAQVRLFPQNVVSKSWRYIFEGRRFPFMGNIAPYYKEGRRLFVFEKAFATAKAEAAIKAYSLPIAAISSVGAHFQPALLEITNVDTVFFFDMDTAGMNAARTVKKKTGARVIVSGRPLDELEIEDMGKYLEKYL